MANSEQHLATLGSNVLIDLNNGDRLTFARLHPSATIKIGNTRCSLSPLIDSPYGSTFELQRGPKGPFLVKVPHSKSSPPDQNQATVEPCDALEDDVNMDSDAVNMLPGRDNRSLVDDNTAQKLSAHDIHRMRMDCASGKDIVDALVANSTTFQNKTAYSQEKYKRKKQKKYAPSFVLRRPSSRRICEAYFIKSPQKIGFLRMDTMGLMMSLANVAAYAEVLVMDMVGGLLTAAAAERTGGCGSVCSVYCTEKPTPLDIVSLLNLSSSMASRVFRASLWELSAALKKDACNDSVGHAAASAEASCKGAHSSSNIMLGNEGLGAEKNDMGSAPDDNSMYEGEGKGDEKDVKLTVHGDGDMHVEKKGVVHVEKERNASGSMENGSCAVLDDEGLVAADEGSAEADGYRQCGDMKPSGMKANEIIRPGRNPSPTDMSRWAKHGFTSLLIGAPEMEPWSIAQELIPLLRPSSPFVIYHRYLQPLAQCMHELQLSKMAVALEIVEPWLREYQILPSRTHPHMQMNATGGYVLSGIKIAPG